jgi:hypothetical protein
MIGVGCYIEQPLRKLKSNELPLGRTLLLVFPSHVFLVGGCELTEAEATRRATTIVLNIVILLN